MTAGPGPDRAFCDAMLPKVSRTFALAIRLLPPDLRHAVQTAYLLCRVADTIEDAPQIGPDTKKRLLRDFGACLDAEGPDASALREAFAHPSTDEDELAFEADRVLREFRELSSVDQAAIRPWVQEMAAGMGEFATRHTEDGALHTLESVAELDRYCYYVAGTVAHLLTGLFGHHESGITEDRRQRLDALATSFGLGLQLTNIIKDVADDRRRGWSFVPGDLCAIAGVRPEDLQLPAHTDQAREVMCALIDKARRHLDDALEYCVTLPGKAYRVRIFCLTSLYFAVRTLRRAERDPRLLDPDHKVKISRSDVYRTVVTTHLVAPFDALVRRYYRILAATG